MSARLVAASFTILSVLMLGSQSFSSAITQSEIEQAFPITGSYSAEGFDVTLAEGWRARALDPNNLAIYPPESLEAFKETDPHIPFVMGLGYSAAASWQWKEANNILEGCEIQHASYEKIGVKLAKVLEIECDGFMPTDQSHGPFDALRIYQFYSESDGGRIYFALVWASTQDLIDKESEAVKQILASFTFEGASDIRSVESGLQGQKIVQLPVMANGKEVLVEVQSRYAVEGLALDEERKTITFKTSDDSPERGYTTIAIDRILEGPYQVAVDGEMKEVPAYYIVEDKESGKVTMAILHGPSQEIEIIGTQVVPEFTSALILISLVLGSVVIAGKIVSKGA